VKHRPAENRTDREARLPLYLRVVTRPSYGECWSLNLSSGGMALAVAAPSGEAPREEASIDVEFLVPGHDSPLCMRGCVKWVDLNAANLRSPHRFAFGICFTDVRPNDRAVLRRYLVDYRPRVALVYPSLAESNLCKKALEPDVDVHAASSEEELKRLLSRGDVYVVIVFGDDETAALAAVERVVGREARGNPQIDTAVGHTPRVVYCAKADAVSLVRLHNEGKLYQSLAPPVDPHWLRLAVKRACEDYAMRSELRRLRAELERSFFRGHARANAAHLAQVVPLAQIIFESQAMRAVFELIQTVAPHRVHVLLQGETGTGKELVARSLHTLSSRADGPFVALDCGVLSETLLESELFGHVEGAFTGATADRPGLFQIAAGGTLLLDEIENTTPALQAKLLRVIDTGEMRPVGGTKIHRVDVRLVAASNRDLRAEVDAGRFRADLFYRLNTFPIDLPPLKQRREDVAPLARYFVRRFAESMGREPGPLTTETEAVLTAYDWPGNVRELRNTVERAVLLTESGQPIDVAVLPRQVFKASAQTSLPGTLLRRRVAEFERELIEAALNRHGGVVRKAAIELGMSPVTLGRRVRHHRLKAS
jgi:two-component system, NtrC family, response regulator HupR/HoxA